jgi:hypothetical protein
MSAAFVHHPKLSARCSCVLFPLLRHLNAGSLAFVMFVALALLNTTRGKETETTDSAAARNANGEIVIDKQHDEGPCVTKTAGQISTPLTRMAPRRHELRSQK